MSDKIAKSTRHVSECDISYAEIKPKIQNLIILRELSKMSHLK